MPKSFKSLNPGLNCIKDSCHSLDFQVTEITIILKSAKIGFKACRKFSNSDHVHKYRTRMKMVVKMLQHIVLKHQLIAMVICSLCQKKLFNPLCVNALAYFSWISVWKKKLLNVHLDEFQFLLVLKLFLQFLFIWRIRWIYQ